jgi:antitoxin ParD1/3/4
VHTLQDTQHTQAVKENHLTKTMQNWCISTSSIFNMRCQNISFTEPNTNWLKSQVKKNEYSTKSELVNDLLRQARGAQAKADWFADRLEKAKKKMVLQLKAKQEPLKSLNSFEWLIIKLTTESMKIYNYV